MHSPGLTVISMLVIVCSLIGLSQADAATQKPNILLVVADDMGWTDLGSYGSEIDTPNLDALAHRGVKFSSFYTSMSCSPTRSMLLSGTDNHIAGVGNMGELLTEEQRGQPGYEGYLNDHVVSLAEVLRENGYHTYMAGKWHLGHDTGQIPHDRGFERSFALLHGGASHWEDMTGLMEVDTPVDYTMNGKKLDKLPGDFYSTSSYTDFLIDSIRENIGDGKPFLAYLAFTTPHDPMHVPEPWLSKYRGQYNEGYDVLKNRRVEGARNMRLVAKDARMPKRFHEVKSWNSLSKEQQAIELRGMEIYAGMVNNMDYHYGRIEAFLKDISELDNTIVIFMSDNGPNPWYSEDYHGNRGSEWFAKFDNSIENLGHPGSNYAYGPGWAEASAGPLSLFKLTVGEGGIRAPLLIDGPGFKGGRQVDSLTYVWDIMPTVLELAGIKHPDKYKSRNVEPMRGKSLQAVLAGATKIVRDKEEFIVGEMGDVGRWIRQGDFKAVWNAPPYGDEKWRLFNIVEDPGETNDLAKAYPELVKTLKEAGDRYVEGVNVITSK